MLRMYNPFLGPMWLSQPGASAFPGGPFGTIDRAFRELDALERQLFGDMDVDAEPGAAQQPGDQPEQAPEGEAAQQGQVTSAQAAPTAMTAVPQGQGRAVAATQPRSALGTTLGAWYPRMDVQVHDDKVVATVDVPGVPREGLSVTVNDGLLTVSGERKEEVSDREHGHYERRFGRFQRAVRLPKGAREEGVTAKYEHGVLRIEVPRDPVRQPTPVSIQ